jgi:hypothetical protein
MRLIRARITESNNVADRTLYTRARSDQLLNIWCLSPCSFSQSRLRLFHLELA